MTTADRGVFHLIYARHASDEDFRRIEPDLHEVAQHSRNLICILESGLSARSFYRHLEPRLRDLPSDVLFDTQTVTANEQELIAAYVAGVAEIDAAYQAWNSRPVEQRRTIFGSAPFQDPLLAWAADHGVTVVREQIPFNAWITLHGNHIPYINANAAAASGDTARMWAESRREWEAYGREGLMRAEQVNAQVRSVMKDHPESNVAYVVGLGHSVQPGLGRGIETIVHASRFELPTMYKFVELFVNGTLDQKAKPIREELETIMFLLARVGLLERSEDDGFRVIVQTREAAEGKFLLRSFVEWMVADPGFQKVAKQLGEPKRGEFIGWAFVQTAIDQRVIGRSEVDQHLNMPNGP